jgi:hypothetical protein
VYCDPPYRGTTTYKGNYPFDHDLFWDWCRWQGKRDVLIFVSEFTGPEEFCFAELQAKSDMHTTQRKRETVEKLFMLHSGNVK